MSSVVDCMNYVTIAPSSRLTATLRGSSLTSTSDRTCLISGSLFPSLPTTTTAAVVYDHYGMKLYVIQPI